MNIVVLLIMLLNRGLILEVEVYSVVFEKKINEVRNGDFQKYNCVEDDLVWFLL